MHFEKHCVKSNRKSVTLRCLKNVHVDVLFQAYKNNLLYPRYLFFTISWYNAGWWKDDVEQYGCTPEQMEQVLEHTLTIVFLPSARYLDPSLTTDTKTDLVSLPHVCINQPGT